MCGKGRMTADSLSEDNRQAIVQAVAVTGPVITTAGMIMALAFLGMVVQECYDNNVKKTEKFEASLP